MADNTNAIISYDPATKTITGITTGHTILVTIVIKKTDGKYNLISQTVKLADNNVIDLLKPTAENNGGYLSNKSESGDVYILPKTYNMKKKKTAKNVTLKTTRIGRSRE